MMIFTISAYSIKATMLGHNNYKEKDGRISPVFFDPVKIARHDAKIVFQPEAHRTEFYPDPFPAPVLPASGCPCPLGSWSRRWTWLTLLLSESNGSYHIWGNLSKVGDSVSVYREGNTDFTKEKFDRPSAFSPASGESCAVKLLFPLHR